MDIKRYAVPAVITMAAVPLLTGCSSSAKSTSPAATTPTSTVSTPPQDTGSPSEATSTQSAQSGTAPSAGTAQPTPDTPPLPSTTAPGATPACRTSTLIIVFPPSDNPVRSSCLHMGVDAQITLSAVGGWVWSPVTSSSPAVVSLTDEVGSDHSRRVTIRPLHPGTTTLASVSSFTPDPHGPASRQWTLTLTVVP